MPDSTISLEPAHFLGAEGHGPLRAHLHAGPAIVVVRRGDHGDGGHVEFELGEIGHRRQSEADVVNLDAGRHQAGDQRVFDRGRIGAVIMARRQFRRHAHFMQQRAEPKTQACTPIRLSSFSNSQRASYSRKPVGLTSGVCS